MRTRLNTCVGEDTSAHSTISSPHLTDTQTLPAALTSVMASQASDRHQLSLGLWPDEGEQVYETCYWHNIAILERLTESARFDWLESRNTSCTSALWRVFMYRAELLNQALARKP